MKISPDDLLKGMKSGALALTVTALSGPCGSGKSRWLKRHVPDAVCVNHLPEYEERKQMSRWRLHHLLRTDRLLAGLIEAGLSWRCKGCGQIVRKSTYAQFGERLRQDFSCSVLIGFPFSGQRDTLVNKGYWRIMTDTGALPLPSDEWLDADILVDRLDPGMADPGRLSDAVAQCLVEGLGEIVIVSDGRRHVYGAHFYCASCRQGTEAVGGLELMAWAQGRREFDSCWGSFEWMGTELQSVLMRTADDWLDNEASICHERFWPVMKTRLLALVWIGLGAISLGCSVNDLSSGERELLLLGRCMEWRVSGQDIILAHPDEGLDPDDQKVVLLIIERLTALGNRVWLESRSKELIDACPVSVGFGRESDTLRGNEFLSTAEQWFGDRSDLNRFIRHCVDQKKGAVLLLQGKRGEGKTRQLRSFIKELKREGTKEFKEIRLQDSDPWLWAPAGNGCLIEQTGVWSWLSGILVHQNEARNMRLLPAHFVRSDPLGRCSACGGSTQVGNGCLNCGGLGIEQRVLLLHYAGMSVRDIWLNPLESVCDMMSGAMPGDLIEKMEALKRVGLAGYPGKQPLSALSSGEICGLNQLLFLLNAPLPCILFFDEPFRGLDSLLIDEMSGQMKRALHSGSLIICATSKQVKMQIDCEELKILSKRA